MRSQRIVYAVFSWLIISIFTASGGNFPQQTSSIPPSDSVGITTIDLQTLQSMPRRLFFDSSKKTVQMVWSAATDQAFLTRGTHFAAFDVSGANPAKIPTSNGWQRIEGSPYLWASIVGFSDGTVGSSASTPVVFSKNISAGTDAFISYQSQVQSSVYPRSAVGANDVLHLIYTFTSGAKVGQIGYLRSENQGTAWESELLLTGATAPGGEVPPIAGADAYVITARGQKVVFAYVDKDFKLWSRLSTNNGQSWQPATMLAQATHTTYRTLATLQKDTVRFVSDTVLTPGFQIDAILDSAGKLRCVFPAQFTYIAGIGIKVGQTIQRIGLDTVYKSEEHIAKYGLAYYEEGKAIELMAPPAGKNWDKTGKFLSGMPQGRTYSCFPQLALDARGAIYCIYTSVKNGDFSPVIRTIPKTDTLNALFGHIYVTHRAKNGLGWSEPLDITPPGTDCLFGTLAETVKGNVYIAYQADKSPGISLADGTPREESVVRFLALPVSSLNSAPVSVAENTSETEDIRLRIYPNPTASECRIMVELPENSWYSVRIVNILGETLANLGEGKSSGRNLSVEWDSWRSGISEGVLFCVVECNGKKAVEPLIIRR